MKTAVLLSMSLCALVACKSDKAPKGGPARGVAGKPGKPVAVPTADLGDELKKPFTDKTGKLGDDYQYPMSKVLWERPMKVDVSHKDAFDAKAGVLYGTDGSHTRVQAIDINTGRVVWTGPADLTKPPKKFDPDKHPKKANDQSLEPQFQILGGKVFVAQNVIKGDAKKGDLVVKIHGYEAATGRRVFTASMPNTWGEGKSWAIWKEEGALLLGDSGDGPIHIIDQQKGLKARYTFNFPAEGSGKWVYAGGGAGNVYFYQDRGTGTLGFAAFDAQTGAARWLSAILQECYNDPMYLRQVAAATIICKWKGRGHNVADRVISFDPASGQAKWATLVFEASAMSKEAKYASNVVVRASADRGALFFRNLHTLVRLDAAGGKEGWRRKLDPERHVLFLIDGKPWKTEIVQAGEFTYDEVVALDAASGKELWKVTTPGKEQSLPGHVLWQKGKLVLFGDFRVYAYEAASGKPLLAMENRFAVGARDAKTKIDSVSLLGDVVVVAASGVRAAYELGSAKKVLHEPSNDETSLNWNLDLDRANLIIFDDDDFVVRALAISGGAAPAVVPPVAKFLTPAAANAVAPRFSATGDRVGFTSDTRIATWSVVLATGQAELWPDYRRHIANGFAVEFVPKGEANTLVVTGKDGKATPVSSNAFGDVKWNRAGDRFVYAETAKATKKQHFSDINTVPEQWVKVYSAAERASTTMLTLANFPEGIVFLRAEWSPDDREVAVLFYVPIGKATQNSFVATVSAAGGARAELKIDDGTGTATLKGLKGRWNGGPTAGLGWVKEELVDAIGWSRKGEFAYVRRAVPTRPRLHVVNAKGKEIAAQDGVTEVAWSPDGAELAVNRHGNVWVWSLAGGGPAGGGLAGAWRQVTAFAPKREPINEEDAVQNPQRIRDLAWSPDGKQVVFGVHQPGPGRRLALVDVKK